MSTRTLEGTTTPGYLLLAGVLAAAASTAPMYLARAAGVIRLDLPLLLGSFVQLPVLRARLLGLIPHTLASVALFPLLYRAGFRVFRLPVGVLGGVLLSVPHWFTSVAGMWLVDTFNPRAVDEGNSEDVERAGRGLAPGTFGQRYGALAPPAIIIGHLVYGAVIGW